jgi:endonuclease YncB( thermonuclease family)
MVSPRRTSDGPRLAALAAACAAIAACAVPARAEWRTYTNCTMVAGDYHDGDSFAAQCGRRSYVFRLYFVDAPETDGFYADRVREQADYWNVTTNDVLCLGDEARRLTARFLRGGFAVQTRRQDAMGQGRKRYYAIVRADGVDLAEELVRHGLARVHGAGTDLADGTAENRVWSRLRQLEREARRTGAGAWGRRRPPAAGGGPAPPRVVPP